MNKSTCDEINSAIERIPVLRDGFYLSSFLIQPHTFHITTPTHKNYKHTHQAVFELSFLLEGKISYGFDNFEIMLSPGDMIFIPPGTRHLWKLHDVPAVSFGYICFISGKGVQPSRQLRELTDAMRSLRYHISGFEPFARCVHTMLDVLSRQTAFCDEEARSLQKLSYISLFKKLLPGWQNREDPCNPVKTYYGHDQLAEQLEYYIYDNFSRPLRLAEFSRHFGMNQDYLNRIFKKETGFTIGQFLTNLRIRQASELLVTSNEDIKNIAIQMGYSDLNYFCHIFRKQTGLTPGEFRHTQRSSPSLS